MITGVAVPPFTLPGVVANVVYWQIIQTSLAMQAAAEQSDYAHDDEAPPEVVRCMEAINFYVQLYLALLYAAGLQMEAVTQPKGSTA